jgi:succinate dehydrogenase/fumarate reductase flavoprotein subunit
MVETIEADVLVAGGGLAGLMAATRAHLAGAQVVLLTGSAGASVRMAGFATALLDGPEDRPEALFNDMFIAGGFLSHPGVLAAVVERIGPETRFFEELGVPFQRKGGKLARRQAAGVSWPRAVFTLDMVGVAAGEFLTQRLEAAGPPNARLLRGGVLLDLAVQDGAVSGGLVYLQAEERWIAVRTPAVVLATGGAGRLFQKTTNFPSMQGTGYALALEAGAPLVDMEFVSYEPTVAVAPREIAGMELPTMAFSEGARLLNGQGGEFLRTAPPPSKDVMSRAMLHEVHEGRGTPSGAIYYDLRAMAREAALGYSQIRRVLKALDLPSEAAQIEVMPTQHFLMGGVATDETAAAEVPGLYAAGEVAGGAHGAHRLATCGGTEVIAMGAIAGESAAQYARGRKRGGGRPVEPRPELLQAGLDATDQARLARIQGALERGCGALRDAAGLEASVRELRGLREELQGEGRAKSFLGRAVLVGLAIASASLARAESRGDHFRREHPQRDDRRWLGNLRAWLGKAGGDLTLTYHRAGIAARTTVPLPGGTGEQG